MNDEPIDWQGRDMTEQKREDLARELQEKFLAQHYTQLSGTTVSVIGHPVPIGIFDDQGNFRPLGPAPCYEDMMVPYPKQ